MKEKYLSRKRVKYSFDGSSRFKIEYLSNEYLTQFSREPLDIILADSESFVSWNDLFQRLKSRGLNQVDLVVSDAHDGLVKALKKQFQGAQWQRYQTHFMRNVMGHAPRHMRAEIASQLKLIFQAENKDIARKLTNDFILSFEKKAAKAADIFEAGLDDALTVLTFPRRYRKRLRTTNLAERMNEEIRRRQRVIRIFPNENAALRLIGCILADYYDEWCNGVRYFDMTEYWNWRKEQKSIFAKAEKIVAIN